MTVNACGADATSPAATSSSRHGSVDQALAAEVRQLAAIRGITPLDGAPRVRQSLVRLGQALAFDKILGGNRNVSCMTCHLPRFATSDGRSLSIGEGGAGLGPERTHPSGVLIPRNAPAIFNASAVGPLFWDGRVEQDAGGSFHTPAGSALTPAMIAVFEFGALSAQPMFPVLSRAEMRGIEGNELATIPDDQPAAVWQGLMARLGAIPRYRQMFEAAYPDVRFEDMNFAYASNAIAGFIVNAFSLANSPWDRFLAGADGALSPVQLRGARDFLSGRCSLCHNGPAFTDNKFHNVAVAQIGPGTDGGDDIGRMAVTGNPADRYAFRTPPLRNVELTAPYGHDGAYSTLRSFVDHYSESDIKLEQFDPAVLEPALQGTLRHNATEILANRDTLLDDVVLSPAVVDELTEFLKALTDPAARHLRQVVPGSVASGRGGPPPPLRIPVSRATLPLVPSGSAPARLPREPHVVAIPRPHSRMDDCRGHCPGINSVACAGAAPAGRVSPGHSRKPAPAWSGCARPLKL